MINSHLEPALSARAATKLPQIQRDGRSPNVSQIHRWWVRGIRGIVLESVVIGGSRCTSSAAVDRWIAKLSGCEIAITESGENEIVDRQLQAAGW
jgi:hypothetical protein